MSSDDQPSPPPDARSGWLPSVRAWMGGGEQKDAASSASATPPAATITLSTEEVRRRRLERMEGPKVTQVFSEVRAITD